MIRMYRVGMSYTNSRETAADWAKQHRDVVEVVAEPSPTASALERWRWANGSWQREMF